MSHVAVFARNYERYLEKACSIAAEDPSRLITFRSAKKWASAKKALDDQEVLRIYLAPVGSKGTVEYEAVLKAVILEPTKGDGETEASLAQVLPETASEGLWAGETDSKKVKTLYVISHCRKLPRAFSLTTLVKVDGGTPLSEDFGYSYALVHELEGDADVQMHPEEVSGPVSLPEGTARRVIVNAYERNSTARKACVAHYGTRCSVCTLDFSVTYGEIGAGFIHVHHLTPLASIKKGYEVNPIEDLRPVCPNCHAMLHRRSPPYTIDELTVLMNIGEQ